jgi:hypothetical protein
VGDDPVGDDPVGDDPVGGNVVGRSAGDGAEYGFGAKASPGRSEAPPGVPSGCGVLSWLMMFTLPQHRVDLLSGVCGRPVNCWACPVSGARIR